MLSVFLWMIKLVIQPTKTSNSYMNVKLIPICNWLGLGITILNKFKKISDNIYINKNVVLHLIMFI